MIRSKIISIKACLPVPALVILAILCSLTNCESESTNCIARSLSPECNGYEPTEGPLIIRVSSSGSNSLIPIQIFYDDFDEGDPFILDTLSSGTKEYILPIGRYSGTAQYLEGKDTILVVAADKIETVQEEKCDLYCWEVKEGKLDLRL